LTSSAIAAARFKEEAKAVASPRIPMLSRYDCGVSENQRAYIIMELLRGSTLRQALNKEGVIRSSSDASRDYSRTEFL
jgi:hypothetical protein